MVQRRRKTKKRTKPKYTKVKGHYRKTPSGSVRVKPHYRRIKSPKYPKLYRAITGKKRRKKRR